MKKIRILRTKSWGIPMSKTQIKEKKLSKEIEKEGSERGSRTRRGAK